MTQKDKQLLISDLSARLSYGVQTLICIEDEVFNIHTSFPDTITSIDIANDVINDDYPIEEVKLYLFPLSSMTKKQKIELKNLLECKDVSWDGVFYEEEDKDGSAAKCISFTPFILCSDIIDWLNSHHFDYKGLIERNLAIDCTNLNIY